MSCELCDGDGGMVLWRNERVRVVRIGDADYPEFCRVVWNAHVKEMTDLQPPDRWYFMRAVFAVELALHNLLNPAKMNLASLGNQTPHLHWHVIPRFVDDRHFPGPVWAEPLRSGGRPDQRVSNDTLKTELAKQLDSALQQG